MSNIATTGGAELSLFSSVRLSRSSTDVCTPSIIWFRENVKSNTVGTGVGKSTVESISASKSCVNSTSLNPSSSISRAKVYSPGIIGPNSNDPFSSAVRLHGAYITSLHSPIIELFSDSERSIVTEPDSVFPSSSVRVPEIEPPATSIWFREGTPW